ncbi:Fanconi anemia group D2 protein homolog [Rhipicephalus sanguineus]|uniref:Fanconi anemia group D2 protein homolog n=1 Tax=Rhipicephalus sanguineus TaxID=34632 RepID=UPI0020C30DD9|nr:Fanconi anemia group D2 protein homolog [Rhipicephalus sanguineus]
MSQGTMAKNARFSSKVLKQKNGPSQGERRVMYGDHMSEVSVRSQHGRSFTSIKVFDDNDEYKKGAYLCSLAKKCGLTLNSGRKHNTLSADSTTFSKDFTQSLKDHAEYPQVVTEVLKEIKEYLDNQDRLQKALTVTYQNSDDNSGTLKNRDSVYRLLLRVEPLQWGLTEQLLEKMVEVAVTDESPANTFHVQVLNQFKWLDGLAGTKAFMNKVFDEVLPVIPLHVRKDLVLALPHILEDSEHLAAARKLGELFTDDKELGPTVLEALSNLYVEPEVISEVRTRVLTVLKSLKLSQLPPTVKFVLSNCTALEAPQVVYELRANLELRHLLPVTSTPTTFSAEEDEELQILTEISNAVQSRRFLRDAWLKIIENVKVAAEHKTLDILFLVMLHKFLPKPEAKSVESLLRKKVRSGHFTGSLLDRTFDSHPQVMKVYSRTMMHLAQVLLWCPEPQVLKFGERMYQRMFVCYEGTTREEVVLNLVTHFGSGVTSQMDAAFDCALDLVRQHTILMAPYGGFFKSTLDILRNLSLCQIRTLFLIIALIAYRGGRQGETYQDELHMVIRKMVMKSCPQIVQQAFLALSSSVKSCEFLSLVVAKPSFSLLNKTIGLTSLPRMCWRHLSVLAWWIGSLNVRYSLTLHEKYLPTHASSRSKRIGVVAALMTVKAMASTKGTRTSESLQLSASTSSSHATPEELVRSAVELLELVRASTACWPQAMSLFYDELSRIVVRGELGQSIETWISDTIITDFQDDYIVDIIQGELEQTEPVRNELCYGLDNLPEGAIALNLLPLLLSEKAQQQQLKPKSKHRSLLTLCSLFRLLRIAEQTTSGEALDGIDALLGCPVKMPASDVRSSFHTLSIEQRETVVSASFYCVNWFRELVNGFCALRDEQTRAKMVDRIRRIVELQKCLEKWLQGVPGYLPPLAVFDIDDADTKPPVVNYPVGKKKRKGKATGKGKKRKLFSDEDSGDEAGPSARTASPPDLDEDGAESGNEDEEADEPEVTAMGSLSASWRPFLRELDFDVFDILNVGLVTGGSESSPSKLTTTELLFVLGELAAKLDWALPSSGPKRAFPFKAKVPRDVGFSNLALSPKPDVVKFMVSVVPHLCSLLEDVSGYFQDLISQNDGVVDAASMFTNIAKETASCMTLLLTCLNAFFSWNGFETSDNRDQLCEAFRSISDRIGTTQLTQAYVMALGKRAFSYFAKFAESVTDPAGATALLRLLGTVADRAQMYSLEQRGIREVAEGFLRRNWLCRVGTSNVPQRPQGTHFNECLQVMLRCVGIYRQQHS